jgi:hypothetical protein
MIINQSEATLHLCWPTALHIVHVCCTLPCHWSLPGIPNQNLLASTGAYANCYVFNHDRDNFDHHSERRVHGNCRIANVGHGHSGSKQQVFVHYDTNVPCQHLHQKPLQPPSPPHSIEIPQQLEEGSVPRAEPEHVACLCCLPVYLRAVRETAP